MKRKLGLLLPAVLLILIVAASLLANVLAPYDPIAIDVSASLQAPSRLHWLGTDDLGRDSFSRLLYGARFSLLGAGLALVVAIALGLPLGLLAGYFGGFVDGFAMRATDTLLSFPGIVLAIGITAALGPNLTNSMIAVGIVGSPVFARLMRSQVLAVKTLPYVEASFTFGAGSSEVMFKRVLPNAIRPVIVQASVYFGYALIAEATLSFLGLGIQAPAPSWGSMLGRAQRYMHVDPFQMLPPGLAITFTVLLFNSFGESLRQFLDPRLKGGRGHHHDVVRAGDVPTIEAGKTTMDDSNPRIP